MKTIYKYPIPLQEVVKLELPKGAEILRVAGVEGIVCLWAIVETNNPKEEREFRLFKTGQEIPSELPLKYLGCGAIFIGQELMLYIFENYEVRN